MEEIWKEVPGFPKYQVSNLGRVMSLNSSKPKIMKPFYNQHGYLMIKLTQLGVSYNKMVHRLVLWAFEGHPKGKQCDHINRVRDDNRLENLRWATRKENRRNQVRSMTFEEYGEMMRLRRLEEEKNKHIQKPL